MVPPTKPTKADLIDRRAKEDDGKPHIFAKNMVWRPSKFSLKEHTNKVEELRTLIERAETAKARNAFRSELRLAKAHLARGASSNGKKVWSSETLHTKYHSVPVFIGPTGKRYISAPDDESADLIIINRKKNRGMEFSRLQRFEGSSIQRQVEQYAEDDKKDAKRSKAKKERREKKRKLKKKRTIP
jgi:hypothetical protein